MPNERHYAPHELVPYAAIKPMTNLTVSELKALLREHKLELQSVKVGTDSFLDVLAANEHRIEPESFNSLLDSVKPDKDYEVFVNEVVHEGGKVTLDEIAGMLRAQKEKSTPWVAPRGVQPTQPKTDEPKRWRATKKAPRQVLTPGQSLKTEDCYTPFGFYERTGLSYEEVLKALKNNGLYSTHTKEVPFGGRKARLVRKTVKYKDLTLTLNEFMDLVRERGR